MSIGTALKALSFAGALVSALPLASLPAHAADEIKLGQTMPYSGAGSAWATIGRAQSAYFDMLNANGGINGHKVVLLSLDDAYAPPKTVEQTRRLVERDGVQAIFGSMNTGGLMATKDYLAAKKIPQLFVSIGANIWKDDPARLGTIFAPLRQTETNAYANQIIGTKPDARVGVLYQNDEFGRELAHVFRISMGDKASLIVKEVSYETTDATVDSQIIDLMSNKVDVFVNFANPKFAMQAIRKSSELGWKPQQYLFSFSALVDSVLAPAGLDASTGIVTATYMKDPSDPAWADDQGVKDYLAFMKTYYPQGDANNMMNTMGYTAGQMATQVLKQAGNDLSGENIALQARSVKPMQLPMVLPGIEFATSADSVTGFHSMKLQRFDGKRWQLLN